MKNIYFTVIFILLTADAWSQHSSAYYHTLADSLYEIRHYQHAANFYEKALKKSTSPAEIMLKLGRSHSKLGEIGKAEEWYTNAKESRANFSRIDTYEYAQILAMMNKRAEAESILKLSIDQHSGTSREIQFFNDLKNYKKYFADSSAYQVSSLPINTDVSEFAPAFYKNGIVYTAATPEHAAKRKYHWDNNHYLNLLFSEIVDNKFQKPTFFEKKLNTKLHDGPASFYNGFNSMIVNRNQTSDLKNIDSPDVWHISLLNAEYSKEKETWQVHPLPFDQPPYSFLHPHISEDGKLLYFVSDKPGGYGGTDIYRSTLVNGVWSEPYNVGPIINTEANEVFPFFIDHALYFASNGRGGLGGLDIFGSQETANGFLKPENMGYPINSIKDDFSMILKSDKREGYFSSSRNGNDDLFSFKKITRVMPMIVRTYDGLTNQSLTGAELEVISATVDNIGLISDSVGNVTFSLPENSEFIIIGKHEDKVGMLYGNAPSASNLLANREVALFSDTTRVTVVGKILGNDGTPVAAASMSVVDQTTNLQIAYATDQSLINFIGLKGHEYKIEVRNDNDEVSETIHIETESESVKELSITLPPADKQITIAAKIFKSEDESPLGRANIEIITFSGNEQKLVADDEGRIDFILPEGVAYLLIGGNENYTGMLSGVAEKNSDKQKVIHPVPAFGDKSLLGETFVVALITDENGNIINDADIVVTNASSGDTVLLNPAVGLRHFKASRDSSYSITVSREGFKTSVSNYQVESSETGAVKISIVLEKEESLPSLQLAAKVFKATDNTILAGAKVTIISTDASDQELFTDSTGVINYGVTENEGYILVARKDGWLGNLVALSEKKVSREFMIHPVPASEEKNQTMVVAQFVDRDGTPSAPNSLVIVDKSTGDNISHHETDGMISFKGKPGNQYALSVNDVNFKPLQREITVTKTENDILKVLIGVERKTLKDVQNDLMMAVKVLKSDTKQPLADAKLVVMSFERADEEYTLSETGEAEFNMNQGNDFLVIASSNSYVGMLSGTMKKNMGSSSMIHLIEASPEKNPDVIPVVAWMTDTDGNRILDGKIIVKETETQNTIVSNLTTGAITFMGEKRKQYDIEVQAGGETKTHHYTVAPDASISDKTFIVIDANKKQMLVDNKGHRTNEKNPDRNLIVFQKDDQKGKLYLLLENNLAEVIEDGGKLYLQNSETTEPLGDAAQLGKTSPTLLQRLGVSSDNITELSNIYFDFNAASLDDLDKRELLKVKNALEKFPSLYLSVTAHADDRGREQYNLQLSRKRARSVGAYLAKLGVSRKRIIQIGKGEEVPEIPCADRDCSENEHQRNRRAEFGLTLAGRKELSRSRTSTLTSFSATAQTRSLPSGFDGVVKKTTESHVQGMVFKISIGAYRYNTSLTFDELNDLGQVETVKVDGLTFYFLSDYTSLSEAESVKAKVIERGIKDAQISCYYNGKKIMMKEMLAMMKGNEK